MPLPRGFVATGQKFRAQIKLAGEVKKGPTRRTVAEAQADAVRLRQGFTSDALHLKQGFIVGAQVTVEASLFA